MNAVGVTIEKALGEAVGRPLEKAVQAGSLPAMGLQFVAHGCGPLILILVNVPALLYEDTPRFYKSLLLRGWDSLGLVLTLVVLFGCASVLVDAYRCPAAAGKKGSK